MRGVRAFRCLVSAVVGFAALSASAAAAAQEPASAAPPAASPTTPAPPPAAPGHRAAPAEEDAAAPPPPADADDPMPPIKPNDAVHRSGFQIGVAAGLGPGAANGYPADARKVGRAAFYTESGVGLGTHVSAWIGGALADGFAFGLGAGAGSISSDGLTSDAWNILFHADVYPLFSLGDAYRDLGVTLEAGTAFATTENDAEDVLIDGNGAAYVGGSVFWEGLSVWKLRSGPFVGGHYLFSETVRRPLLLVGYRGTLTTGP